MYNHFRVAYDTWQIIHTKSDMVNSLLLDFEITSDFFFLSDAKRQQIKIKNFCVCTFMCCLS